MTAAGVLAARHLTILVEVLLIWRSDYFTRVFDAGISQASHVIKCVTEFTFVLGEEIHAQGCLLVINLGLRSSDHSWAMAGMYTAD
jgi:hypothetical protein